jgi:DNA-binding SARP family transcriptional activator
MADAADAGLSRRALERATAVSGGAVGIVGDICAAAATLGAPLVEQSLVQAGSADDLLARLARAWISTATAETQQALALALHLEYSHPQLMAAALDAGRPPVGPWMVPLAEGWQWVRRHWREPMRRAMRAGARPAGTQLHRAACWLGEQGATERAIPLLLEAGDLNTAAQMIAAAADGCMSHGQWQTLAGWLDALPSATLRAWPWLIYAGGDLASARGQPGVARKAFDMAASLFTARHDPEGACQSMLAESALAAWQGDRAHAQARALAASTIADAVNLSWYQAWAAWQLGCLAASTGELDDALAYFERAAAAAAVVGDPMVLDLLRQVDALVLRQRDIRRQRDFHQQAFVAAERAELEAAEHLRRALSAPPEGLDLLLDVHGWSRMPLMLKLPAPVLVANEDAEPERKSLWQSLLGVVGLRRRPRLEPELAPPPAVLSLRPSLSLVRSQLELEAVTVAVDVADARSGAGSGLLEREVNALPPTELVLLPASPESGDPALTPPALAVHMLGPFRVLVNERAVESWPSGRGRALFKYLAAHHPQPIARDTLMDMFWPEAAPEAARNSLNVALHGLRQAFRALTDVPVVLFHEGAYRINPELRLWVDAEEFERRVDAGRRIQGVGELGGATAEYEVATGLYQGDFMADDPYDDWPVLARERLRVSYLDTLDRLGQIYFGQGKYAACANLCQLILVRDSCREDAHCRLMRCYARQGQHPLALRQYQACVEALRKELDVEPAPATTQLGERIRRREQV